MTTPHRARRSPHQDEPDDLPARPPRAPVTRELELSAAPLTLRLTLAVPHALAGDETAGARLSLTQLPAPLDALGEGAPLSGEALREHLALLGALGLPRSRHGATLSLRRGVQLIDLEARYAGEDATCLISLDAPDPRLALDHLERLALCERCEGSEELFMYAKHTLLASPEHLSSFVSAQSAALLGSHRIKTRSVQVAWRSPLAHGEEVDDDVVTHRLSRMQPGPQSHSRSSQLYIQATSCVLELVKVLFGQLISERLHTLEFTHEHSLFTRLQRMRLMYLLERHGADRRMEREARGARGAREALYAVEPWEGLLALAGVSVKELTLVPVSRHHGPRHELAALFKRHLTAFALSPLGARAQLPPLDDADLSEACLTAQGLVTRPDGVEALWRLTANTAALTLWGDRGAWALSDWESCALPALSWLMGGDEEGERREDDSWLELPEVEASSLQRTIEEACARQGLPSPMTPPRARSSRLTISEAESACALIHACTLLLLERPEQVFKSEQPSHPHSPWTRRRLEERVGLTVAPGAFSQRLASLLEPRPLTPPACNLVPIAEPWTRALLAGVTVPALQRALVALCHLSLSCREQRTQCTSYSLLQLLTSESPEAGGVEEVLAVSPLPAARGGEALVEAWLRPERLHRLVAVARAGAKVKEGEPPLLMETPVSLNDDISALPELMAWLCALREEVSPEAMRLLRLGVRYALNPSRDPAAS